MKKIVVVAIAMVCAMTVKAACVDWKVSGTAGDVGKTVYLLTAADSYNSVDALAAASVASASIVSAGRGAYNTGDKTADSAAITTDSAKSMYFAIVADDGKSYNYVSADLSSYVYDPNNQETSPGKFTSLSLATIASGSSQSIGGGNVPEPTTGFLVLFGLAGLALKRKLA